jgi:hypothetical protein
MPLQLYVTLTACGLWRNSYRETFFMSHMTEGARHSAVLSKWPETQLIMMSGWPNPSMGPCGANSGMPLGEDSDCYRKLHFQWLRSHRGGFPPQSRSEPAPFICGLSPAAHSLQTSLCCMDEALSRKAWRSHTWGFYAAGLRVAHIPLVTTWLW